MLWESKICILLIHRKLLTTKTTTMLNLTIETTDKSRQGDVVNAYNEGLDETNIENFMQSLRANIGSSIVGKGGNHIWIAELDGKRIATITL